MIRLSAFADEISPDLEEQIVVLSSEKVRFLDLRGVWKARASVIARSKWWRCSSNELSMGTFPMGEPIAATPIPCASSVFLIVVTC